MRVCVLAFAHDVRDGRVFHRGAVPLVRDGHTVTMIARRIPGRARRRTDDMGVRVVSLPPRPGTDFLKALSDPFAFLLLLWAALRHGWGRADVYHCHEYQTLLVGYLLSRFSKARLIYDCHEYQPENYARLFGRIHRSLYAPVRKAYECVERWLSRRVDAVVTVNDALGARFSRDCQRVIVLPNYPSRDLFRRVPDPPRAWQTKLHDKEVLVFLGYVSKDRGVTASVRLLGHLAEHRPDSYVLFVGNVTSRYHRELLRLAGELGVVEKIGFTGRVAHEEMLSFARLASVGLNLILNEPRKNQWAEPAKCFQYAAAGVPIVSSGAAASRKLIEAMGNGIIVNPEDPLGAAEQVAGLLGDKACLMELGTRGRKAFEERFCMEGVEKRLLGLYEIIGGKQSPC